MTSAHEERVVLWVRGALRPDAPQDAGQPWLERTCTRAHVSGAQVLLRVGTSVVVTFDGIELEDAVEFARHCLETDNTTQPVPWVHVGISLGTVSQHDDDAASHHLRGAALDRAQALSHRARAGEIVFDEAAEQRADELFLFGREVAAEYVRGHVLDPVFWNKRDCRAALSRLKPGSLPPTRWDAFETLRAIALRPGQQRVVLYSDAPSSGLLLLQHLMHVQPPSLALWIGRSSGALRPLGGLALGLERLAREQGGLEALGVPQWTHETLRAIGRGAALQRSEVVDALAYLLRPSDAQARPLVVIEELQDVDPATIGVIAEVFMIPELDALLFTTLPAAGSLPAQLMPRGELHELRLDPLPLDDRIALARSMLSLSNGGDVAQRVAMLGPDTTLGVLEAVRTLVSAGDLVLREGQFGWRRGPRVGATGVPVEALLTERVTGLVPNAYRVLEAICACPRGTTRKLVEHVAVRDGLSSEEFNAGLLPLIAEGFVDERLSLGLGDATIRGALRNIMPPARAAELHRFVAERLRAACASPCFMSGELAYHLAEGGLISQAAAALVDAAQAAADTGFARVALRLLATALEWDGSPSIRKAASDLARTISGPSLPPPRPRPADPQHDDEELESEDLQQPENLARSAMQAALQAFAVADYEGVERCLDAAVAAGCGRAAAQRVLAMSHLARGELSDAMRTLQRDRADAPAEVRARESLSWALLHLCAGNPQLGVRDALAALARNRQLGDGRGEIAALHVLSLGYRMLKRDEEAAQLEAAALAQVRV